MEKQYMKLEMVKSKALGCYVNCFLNVQDVDENHVRLIVTHIPAPQWDRRNHVASNEVVERSLWEKAKKWTLNGMVEC